MHSIIRCLSALIISTSCVGTANAKTCKYCVDTVTLSKKYETCLQSEVDKLELSSKKYVIVKLIACGTQRDALREVVPSANLGNFTAEKQPSEVFMIEKDKLRCLWERYISEVKQSRNPLFEVSLLDCDHNG